MIFVITVSQWSFIWLRVIKYLLLPVAYPALQPSSQTRLGYVSCKHVCICTRGDSSPSSVPVFHLVLFAFNSFNLPPGTCAIFLSPLLSLSLFARLFQTNAIEITFLTEFKRLGFNFTESSLSASEVASFFLFFFEQQTKEDSINLVNYWILESNRVLHVGEMEVIIDDYWFLMV